MTQPTHTPSEQHLECAKEIQSIMACDHRSLINSTAMILARHFPSPPSVPAAPEPASETEEIQAATFRIHWTNQGYKVSIPNLEEANVVRVEVAEGLERRLAAALARGKEEKDLCLYALNECDSAFANWQVGQIPGRPEDILRLINLVRSCLQEFSAARTQNLKPQEGM